MLALIRFMIGNLEIFEANTEVHASNMNHTHVFHRLVVLWIVRKKFTMLG